MQGRSTADRIRSKRFPLGLRGYDRVAVDAWLREVADLVERLEQRPPPRDAAVRRALDEVGQETAAILQRAHDAAEEIEARARAQAEGRLQRAEREAQQAVADAEQRAARLESDTRRVWDERSRLLEELRRLADEVLAVADDAIERLRPPGAPAEAAPFEAATELREELDSTDQPTVEVEIAGLDDRAEEPPQACEPPDSQAGEPAQAGGERSEPESDPRESRA